MALHPVVIDDEQIQAVYAKYIGTENQTAEGEYIPRGEAEQQFNPDAWRYEAEFITTALFQRITPNWEIPLENQEKFASSLSVYLSRKWPQGLLGERVEKMSPGLRALWELGNCARYGFDVENFKMRPMQTPQETPEQQGETEAQPQQQKTKSNKPFTTDA